VDQRTVATFGTLQGFLVALAFDGVGDLMRHEGEQGSFGVVAGAAA
jgi:hypothetical protein